MKKAFIIGGAIFAIAVGFLIYLLSYAYDKNHYGESFEMYADPSTCSVIMTAEYKGDTYLIHPYCRYEVYRTITRGRGALKKHLFGTETEGEKIVIKIGTRFVITIYEDEKSEDKVYITIDDDGSKKHYSLEGFKTFPHMIEAISKDAGNLRIISEAEGDDFLEKKNFAETFIGEFKEEGGQKALESHADPAMAEVLEQQDQREYIRQLDGELDKVGKLNSIDDLSCYLTDSESASVAMFGAANFESGWKPFMLMLDSEGRISSFDFF